MQHRRPAARPGLALCVAATLALAFTLCLTAEARAEGSPVGVWETIDDETGKPTSHVQIWESEGTYYGRVVKLLRDPPDSRCVECKGDRKDQPIVGMTILWGMKKDDDEYSGGKILDPKNGKTYRCKLWRKGSRLKVRGYVLLFFRTQTWNLVSGG